jgi:hypothetical protein
MKLTNEERAHDLACAMIANPLIFESFINKKKSEGLENSIDVGSSYNKAYELALSHFNKTFPID